MEDSEGQDHAEPPALPDLWLLGPRPRPVPQVTTRAWYLCWASLLPSSCEAEKLVLGGLFVAVGRGGRADEKT